MTGEITVYPGSCRGVIGFGVEAMVVTATLLLAVIVVSVGGITSAFVIVTGVMMIVMVGYRDRVVGEMGIADDRLGR